MPTCGGRSPAAIRLVVFDVGETLVDESRMWGEWAERLGVTRLAFFAALGAVIAGRRHHNDVYGLVRPDLDPRAARAARGPAPRIERRDLYPDAVPTLARLRGMGLRLGLAGNQPADAESEIRALGLDVDFVASSARWGVEKPDPAFFRRIVGESGFPATELAYVGDRLDNDVFPAMAAGMLGVFLRRGPWGVIHAAWPEAARADLRLETLAELPDALVAT